jgi:hypothetical protein
VEGRGVARYKSTARDLGAFICFEDETGQGLSPPKGRTWAPRGARPVVRVRGAGGGRVSIAGVACYRPGDRPRLFYQLRIYRRRKGEAKGLIWGDYRDLIIATHRNLSAPLIWCWDNLNIHLAPELAHFAAETRNGCGSFSCPRTRRTSIPPRASGRCSSGPWPTSPPPTWTAWSTSSNAS